MIPKICLLTIVLYLPVSGILPVLAQPEYPANPVTRPLILPENTVEIALGPAFLSGNPRSRLEPYMNFRYAVTEKLEIANLGVRYLFASPHNSQWAATLQNYGVDLKGHHHTMLGIEAKQLISYSLAMQYALGYYFADSHEKDGTSHETRASLGAILGLIDSVAVELQYAYRDISGFETKSASLYKAGLIYNYRPGLDIVVGYGHSEFNEAVDSILFNESYRNRYDLYVKWRF